jgi:hypothetical protein
MCMSMRVHGRSLFAARVGQPIGQVKDNRVAGMHPQVRRFAALCIRVAVAHGAVCLRGIASGEVCFENTILAAQVCWFFDDAPGFWARTDTFRSSTPRCQG